MLIYTRHDPRFFDRRLHKGGDGGAGQMRQDELDRQRQVQAAVDTINRTFGVGGNGGVAPSRDKFTNKGQMVYTPPAGGGDASTVGAGSFGNLGIPGMTTGDGWTTAPDQFDQAGYDKAVAEWKANQTAATTNKTAREKMYADISGAVQQTAMRDLDRQYSKASQRNKFGLARSGLLGGSVDAESGGELTTLYGEGKLKAAEAGKGAASDLRVNDEKTRQNLIGLAQSGMDTGTAASLAAGQMGAAADMARSQTGTATVGRLFDDMSQAYVNNQVMRARYPNGMPGQQPSGYQTSVFNPSRYHGTAGR